MFAVLADLNPVHPHVRRYPHTWLWRWENPLMGWTSTGDPYANVGDAGLTFDSEEAAQVFAEKHGWDYMVKKRHTPLLRVKAYSDNFKWKGPPKAEA